MRGPVETLGQPAVDTVGYRADGDQDQRRPVVAGVQRVDGRPDERDAHQADEVGKVAQHRTCATGRRRNAIVPPAFGSIRSKRALAPSAASNASAPPRVTHGKRGARSGRFGELHAAHARGFAEHLRGARVFLERGHALDFDQDGELGQCRIHRGIAHEYVGRAMHALFERAVPGFADARRIQRPAPGATIGNGIAVTDEDSVGALALGGGERRLRPECRRWSEGSRLRDARP